ncbi:glutathione synthase [Nannocystis bainbridge]|uniref:Glutathione synthetase n=1 Tax=Nannocystis bainbridge TaxID=2995303 RepID=A0ABT5E9K1_9BACT|nr:glutathione synthase [Nannocystis bainbridge]MDC0722105.1 glutathione synthase [Nannocystis bainbridge]
MPTAKHARGDVLFVLDPLETIHPKKDSSYLMIAEALRRGYQPWSVELPGLLLRGADAVARATPLGLHEPGAPLAPTGDPQVRALASFRVVVMRKDPPVDPDFVTATWCLDRAVSHTLVINQPQGLRDLSEKLAILDFPQFIPRTFLLRTIGDLRDALAELGGQMILKPVFGFGGREVLIARDGDPNLSTLFELATHDGRTWTIAQEFVPAAKHGDKRILLVDGEAIGAVMRVPADGELRNNFHAGGSAALTRLSARDREICAAVGPFVRDRGQFFVGIDVLGEFLTEINVTSPTGMQEINRLGGLTGDETMQARFWAALEPQLR